MKIYIDTDDQWAGRYRGPHHNYVCLVPCVVIRWRRRVPYACDHHIEADAAACECGLRVAVRL